MKVFVEDAVFDRSTSPLDVLELFNFAIHGRHRIALDEDGPSFRAWLSARGAEEQEWCQLALDGSASAEATTPSTLVVRIAEVRSSDWEGSPPRLRLGDALRLLREPFRVMLEDWGTDWHFILCMATRQQRDELAAKGECGHLVTVNGGGVENMRKRIGLEMQDQPHAHICTWMLFDSDALQPDSPGKGAMDLIRACGDRIRHHCLKRRAVENYLTRQALDQWARNRSGRSDRRAVVDAFMSLAPAQQWHYNMKEGFDKDAKNRDRSPGALYDDLSPATRELLRRGFGHTVRDLFADGVVTEADLRQNENSGWDEGNAAVATLIGLLR